MLKSNAVKCYNCDSTILSLTKEEIEKLSGLTFLCECCGYENVLYGNEFNKAEKSDPNLYIYSFESLSGI